MKLTVGELYSICSSFYVRVTRNNETLYSNVGKSAAGVFSDVSDLFVEGFVIFKDFDTDKAYMLIRVEP